MSKPATTPRTVSSRAFTLIELLIVVAIIAILALIAVFNMREATERALKSADAANMHTLATGLQSYVVDFGKLPPADCVAGPFSSSAISDAGNAPAAGGSWNGVPWILVDLKYVPNWQTLFCPKYLKIYSGGATIHGAQPRYHNFRYAYNMGSALQGGEAGGSGKTISGNNGWIVRDLYLSAQSGFYGASAPRPPADYVYPWGDSDKELVFYADCSVKQVLGGTDTPAQ